SSDVCSSDLSAKWAQVDSLETLLGFDEFEYPSSVSSESTWAHFAEAIATIMVMPSAPAERRVSRPTSRNRPPKNSTPETKGASSCGKGTPQPMKFSVTCGRLCNFPQPLHRNTQPTVTRANSGASQPRCPAT